MIAKKRFVVSELILSGITLFGISLMFHFDTSYQLGILLEIKDYEERLSHSRDLLATRQIDADDYRVMKSQYTSKISVLEAQLTRINYDTDDIQNIIKQGIIKINEINEALNNDCLGEVRKEIGSIFPENIVFSDGQVRTARRNEFIQYINLINRKLNSKKNGTKTEISVLSREVGVAGFEPTTSSSQTRRDTGLRYTPKKYHLFFIVMQIYSVFSICQHYFSL